MGKYGIKSDYSVKPTYGPDLKIKEHLIIKRIYKQDDEGNIFYVDHTLKTDGKLNRPLTCNAKPALATGKFEIIAQKGDKESVFEQLTDLAKLEELLDEN